jgi:hypothetical protein
MVTSDTDDDALTPEQARVVARARWLMAISGIATVPGIAVVVTIIGYRVFNSEGSPGAGAAMTDLETALPKGARVVATAVASDRIVVTLDIGGETEVRTYDARTLRPLGRLRFTVEK